MIWFRKQRNCNTVVWQILNIRTVFSQMFFHDVWFGGSYVIPDGLLIMFSSGDIYHNLGLVHLHGVYYARLLLGLTKVTFCANAMVLNCQNELSTNLSLSLFYKLYSLKGISIMRLVITRFSLFSNTEPLNMKSRFHTHQMHSITRPHGRAMECIWWEFLKNCPRYMELALCHK